VGTGGLERFDAVVIGSGSGGRGVANRLADAGMSVAVVEAERVGGECPYWACMPSKALLRPVEAVGEALRVPGVMAGVQRFGEVVGMRDEVTFGRDDARKAGQLAERGAAVVRGRGRLAGPGRVEVDGRVLAAERVVIATGSAASVPPIDGLQEAGYWTNREATALERVPDSAIVLGGGPVGVEVAQILGGYGSRVSLVQRAERLLTREEPEVGELLADALSEAGIDLRLGAEAESVRREDGRARLRLADGEELTAARVVVATGRRPRVEDIGLETVGIAPDERGIQVDERCRAAQGVWAVGDVTSAGGWFTHVAAYQARIASADILGEPVAADYRAVPRVVFGDPEVAAVGLTAAQAAERGLQTAAAAVDLGDTERAITYGRGVRGRAGVLADARRGVLVGAHAVGPLAGEWIHMAVLAIRAEVPLPVLRDTIAQFPTFSESLIAAARELPA
jgi:dihydrolipoamide dehydrogenase